MLTDPRPSRSKPPLAIRDISAWAFGSSLTFMMTSLHRVLILAKEQRPVWTGQSFTLKMGYGREEEASTCTVWSNSKCSSVYRRRIVSWPSSAPSSCGSEHTGRRDPPTSGGSRPFRVLSSLCPLACNSGYRCPGRRHSPGRHRQLVVD